MPEPLLHVEGLSKTYAPRGGFFRPAEKPRPALVNAGFTLGKGEILGVVGESGSGKTTLARCVALLERPDSGRIVFKGEDLAVLSERELRKRDELILQYISGRRSVPTANNEGKPDADS